LPRATHGPHPSQHLQHHQAREEADKAAAEQERQRQREADRRQEEAEGEAEKRRMRAAYGTAVAAYNALLAEMVKDPAASYRDWRTKLMKDSQVLCCSR